MWSSVGCVSCLPKPFIATSMMRNDSVIDQNSAMLQYTPSIKIYWEYNIIIIIHPKYKDKYRM